jgi:hypothetical protein
MSEVRPVLAYAESRRRRHRRARRMIWRSATMLPLLLVSYVAAWLCIADGGDEGVST